MIRTAVAPSIPAAILLAAALAGCSSSQPAPEVRGKTAAERPLRFYSGDNACTSGIDVVLAPQAGSPSGQAVCGITTTDPGGGTIHVYRGIPYADPPTGAFRWTDPRPPTFQEIPATEFGPRCPQGKAGELPLLGGDESEDCLYLNVWTPEVTADGSGTLPVMVFIHGGAFISGSGGSAQGLQPGHLNLYDGAQFVSTSRTPGPPVVFVTLNYRLGVLGFLAGNTIGLDGNYGLKDQTAALRWVQRNISRFGGDPARVMIFGESAGAQSTALHLTIEADGHQALFARAALESNYGISYQTVAEAQGKADAFALAATCNGAGNPAAVLACLRALPLAHVLESQLAAWGPRDSICNGLQTVIPWQPVIDGTFVQKEPIEALIRKPILLGSNLTESIPFVLPWFPADPFEGAFAYPALLAMLFGDVHAAAIYAAYEVEYGTLAPLAKMEHVVTDYLWTCFNRALARRAAAAGQPAWRYHDLHHGSFSVWTNPYEATQGKTATACATSPAVCHADELPFVFGNPSDMKMVQQSFTPDEASLSAALQGYWIQFARTGNPNQSGLPAWPRHDSGSFLQLKAPASAIAPASDLEQALDASCEIWDSIGYVVRSALGGSEHLCPVTASAPAMQGR
ncbi:MAG: carboxylesterase family protein [Anaeromyxobacteraceae bacterium]